MKQNKECVICGKYVPPARLEVRPNAKTCGPGCAVILRAKLQREHSRRRRAEKNKKKEAK